MSIQVPPFDAFLDPILRLLNNDERRTWSEIAETVATRMGISAEQRLLTLPSGRTYFNDRIQWAITYLAQAGLVSRPARGIVTITERGKSLVNSEPKIRKSHLEQYPEYVDFKNRSKKTRKVVRHVVHPATEEATPEETIDDAYSQHVEALASELLELVKGMTPSAFEQLIVQLMLRLGYGSGEPSAGKVLGKSGDGGVDGVISLDALGLDKVYLQAKRWNDAVVSSKDIQAFVGSLHGLGANKGVFITTSQFSKDAEHYAERTGQLSLVLIDGLRLARLMVEHGLGVAVVREYQVKRIDSDFFEEL